MAENIIMPQLGETVAEGKIVSWFKKVGDAVAMTWLDHWPDRDERTRVVFITQGIAKDSLKEVIELLDRMLDIERK